MTAKKQRFEISKKWLSKYCSGERRPPRFPDQGLSNHRCFWKARMAITDQSLTCLFFLISIESVCSENEQFWYFCCFQGWARNLDFKKHHQNKHLSSVWVVSHIFRHFSKGSKVAKIQEWKHSFLKFKRSREDHSSPHKPPGLIWSLLCFLRENCWWFFFGSGD